MSDPIIAYHLDAELFRDAVRFTAAETGFSELLIEKDYYCSVALADICASENSEIVFKGGTCLSKVHADFFRLSEDLDFAVSTPTDSTRSQRSRQLDGFKSYFAMISERCGCFQITAALRGFNNSLQYGARLAYKSAVTGQDESIKIEVSVREPVVEPSRSLPARTLLRDPFRRAAAVESFETDVLTIREAYAEKLRAAMTRRDPAIRDFFDLDHAFTVGKVDPTNNLLIELLRAKLSISANDRVDVSQEKLAHLGEQVETQLRPVLRGEDFDRFNLERAFQHVVEFANAIDKRS